MTRYVALIRGINIGGRKIVRMDALRALCAELGLGGARTLLQSGNLVFRSPEGDPRVLAETLAGGIERIAGFRPGVLIRTAAEWDGVLAGNPFTREAAAEPRKTAVAFLEAPPASAALAALEAAHRGPERLALQGRELYLFYPEGFGRSKLTHGLIERHLEVAATARNWNTVTKIAALLEDD